MHMQAHVILVDIPGRKLAVRSLNWSDYSIIKLVSGRLPNLSDILEGSWNKRSSEVSILNKSTGESFRGKIILNRVQVANKLRQYF